MSVGNDLDVSALVKQFTSLATALPQDDAALQKLQGRRELQKAVRELSLALETSGDIVDRYSYSPTGLSAIRVGVDLDIFTIVVKAGKPVTAKDLVEATGADYRLLTRILRVLVAIGALNEVGLETYTASRITAAYATPKGISAAKFFQWLYQSWVQLPNVLINNKYQNIEDAMNTAVQLTHGANKHLFQILLEKPEEFKWFNAFMSAQRAGRPNFSDFFPVESQLFSGFKEGADSVMVVDVGGAVGNELRILKTTYPNLPGRLILQDLPHTIDQVPADAPFEKMVVDFFQPQPVKGARAYYFRNIFHDWVDEKAHIILTHTREAMTPGYSKILINELNVPVQGAGFYSTASDVNMMCMVAGVERTEPQWRALIEGAGLKIVKIWTVDNDQESIFEVMTA